MIVKFKREYEDVKLPIKGSENAACYDVFAHSIKYDLNGKVIVDLGFRTEIPVGYKFVMQPRSSFTKYMWTLNNSPCQIDSDFRGVWKVIFTPIIVPLGGGTMSTAFPYNVGDRVAQICLERVMSFDFEVVNELSETSRGEGGFGSTGL